jgi:glycerophosphoryl diester phosphodiesterase
MMKKRSLKFILPLCLLMLWQSQLFSSPVFIAHRGGIVPGFPENTMKAYQNAIAHGAHAIEIDLRTTKDGEIVIMHDATVDRTTNGSGNLADMTLAELKRLDLGEGEQIPTYEEVLQLTSQTGVVLLLDIKDGSSEAAKKRIVQLTEKYHSVLKVIVGVRNVEDLNGFLTLNRNLRMLGFIQEVKEIEAFINAGVNIIRLWPEWIDEDQALIQKVHSFGRPVWSTVGNRKREELESLLSRGVNGVLMDNLKLMRDICNL